MLLGGWFLLLELLHRIAHEATPGDKGVIKRVKIRTSHVIIPIKKNKNKNKNSWIEYMYDPVMVNARRNSYLF